MILSGASAIDTHALRLPNAHESWLAFSSRADYILIMQTLVIEVSGGVIQEVYGEPEKTRVILLNWDAGESPGDAFDIGSMPLQPMALMPDATRVACKYALK